MQQPSPEEQYHDLSVHHGVSNLDLSSDGIHNVVVPILPVTQPPSQLAD